MASHSTRVHLAKFEAGSERGAWVSLTLPHFTDEKSEAYKRTLKLRILNISLSS